MLRATVAAAVLSAALEVFADPGSAGTGSPPVAARARAATAGLSLDVPRQLRLGLEEAAAALDVAPRDARDAPPPPCVADLCQPRVDVPGMDRVRRVASRTELVVALLDHAHVEPIASLAWFFVVTGLRVDWTPASMDHSFGATAGGWGNVFVRLRVRLDPWNTPTIPLRPRERQRREHELAVERARAADAERVRHLVAAGHGHVPSGAGDHPGGALRHDAVAAPRGM